jgi:hypothetical protein
VASPLSRLVFPIALGLCRKLRSDRAERLAMEMGRDAYEKMFSKSVAKSTSADIAAT